eukprot:131266_1
MPVTDESRVIDDEWVSEADLQNCDRSETTKDGHKFAWQKFIEFGHTSIDEHGLGLPSDWEPKLHKGYCLTKEEFTDQRISQYLTFWFNHYRARKMKGECEVYSSMRKLNGWVGYQSKILDGLELKDNKDMRATKQTIVFCLHCIVASFYCIANTTKIPSFDHPSTFYEMPNSFSLLTFS